LLSGKIVNRKDNESYPVSLDPDAINTVGERLTMMYITVSDDLNQQKENFMVGNFLSNLKWFWIELTGGLRFYFSTLLIK
jgi:hypothetical protein